MKAKPKARMTPINAVSQGVLTLMLGGGLLAWTLTPPGTGVSPFSGNAPLARSVVEAVRANQWGLASATHDWASARADGGIAMGAVRELEGGRVRVADATMQVVAPPSLLAEGMIRPARRTVEAVVVQECSGEGCAPAYVHEVRFEGQTLKDKLVPEGSVRQELLEKGKDKLRGFLGKLNGG